MAGPARYDYDVFLSYRAIELWPKWLDDHFEPLLNHYLRAELGRKVRVFRYEDERPGVDWPLDLANKLARSRVLLPLLWRPYFESIWCRTELTLMRAREQALGLRCAARPQGLIVPVTVHDGEHFPEEAKRLESVDLRRFAVIHLADGSPKKEHLEETIRDSIAPAVHQAMTRAPTEPNPAWLTLSATEFEAAYALGHATQGQPVI